MDGNKDQQNKLIKGEETTGISPTEKKKEIHSDDDSSSDSDDSDTSFSKTSDTTSSGTSQ